MAKKSPRGSVDTNVLLRLILNDVPAQARAVERLLKKGGVFVVEDATLIEMVFVLEKVYAFPRDVVTDNVLFVIGHEQFACSAGVFERVVSLYVAQPKLSFMDCMLVVYACVHDVKQLHTFDKALVKGSGGTARVVA